MWELDCKEGWVSKNWCFWTLVLEKTLESPLGCKIKQVNPKGNQSWIFIGRTDAEAEALTLWPSDEKNWLTGKDPNAGKNWRPEEKRTTEDEMVGWHHRLDGHEFEQALGVGDGQGNLACSVAHGVAKSRTWLSDWTVFVHCHLLRCSLHCWCLLYHYDMSKCVFPISYSAFLSLNFTQFVAWCFLSALENPQLLYFKALPPFPIFLPLQLENQWNTVRPSHSVFYKP